MWIEWAYCFSLNQQESECLFCGCKRRDVGFTFWPIYLTLLNEILFFKKIFVALTILNFVIVFGVDFNIFYGVKNGGFFSFSIFDLLWYFSFLFFLQSREQKKERNKVFVFIMFFLFFTKRKVLKQVLKKRAGKSSYRVLNVSFCSFSSFWCFFFCKKRSTKKMKKNRN